uniref:Peroxisomal membrane protein PEX14 n=1 Tax=Alexandrium monilatum TaxID=311494 RepID=A0A7S4VQQ0_9DINO|mmetsp:Transcript_24979/g.74503  ORF Transcript_24979/g.74503 Transcript_24979/m.74503 type:complete len:107 (+) Transcript_24979:92-412(+)
MRELLVEQARRFLQHEGVRHASRAEQRAFLESKGLSEEEVDAAHALVNGGAQADSAWPSGGCGQRACGSAKPCASTDAATTPTSSPEASCSSTSQATARQKLSYLF